MWTLAEGVEVVRRIQPLTRDFNYRLVIGGGVVNVGFSRKDLDLFFLPLCNSAENDSAGMLCGLEFLWGKSEPLGGDGEYADDPRYTKVKFTLGAGPHAKRIDAFIWK
jgi:hypothetical protein